MTTEEDKLAEEAARIEALKRDNKNIDTAALVAAAFEQAEDNGSLPASLKARGYLISLLLPPFGLYYMAKFFLRTEADARRSAWICLVLTIIGAVVFWWTLNRIFNNPTVQQIQQITPQDIQQLTQ